MISNSELHRRLAQQPFWRMRCFAALLGWKGLQLEYVLLPDEQIAESGVPDGLVVYYMTTDWKFNLQINTKPHGQTRTFCATVTATRYGIRDIGFHDFVLHESDDRLVTEVHRMAPLLNRDIYKSRDLRRALIESHTEHVYPVFGGKKKRRGSAPK